MNRRANIQFNGVAVAAFIICLAVGIWITALTQRQWPAILFGLVGLYLLYSIRVVRQWEKVALLRLGHYVGLRGPGIFFIVPVLETLSPFVDQRVRVTSVTAESTLSRDTVPVDVDAIIFWLVWNAEKAILEVENYLDAITLSAQTALRESIGRHELAQMITDREALGHELQRILDEKTNPWGITVQSVEVRDVRIPQALQDAMSRQAQAEREKQARVILGSAEAAIAGKFVEAADTYAGHPAALQLRAMNIIYETTKERGTTILIPSSMVDTLNPSTTLALAFASKAAPDPQAAVSDLTDMKKIKA